MKYLFIGAHFDDIEIAVGGTLNRLISEGNRVKVVICSSSGYTNLNGEVQRSEETASKEGLMALNYLGAEDISVLDLKAKEILFNSHLIELLEKEIVNFNPDYIFTHHPHDIHQDHQNVAKATCAASRNYNNIYFYEPFGKSGRCYDNFNATLYFKIDHFIDAKINSLRIHESEYSKFGKDYWTNAIISRCQLRGYEANCKFAECFQIFREVV